MNTQDLLKTIKDRRNTKSFTEEEVKKSDIELILESGVWAPNHRNTEPWRFVVIDKSSELKKEISKSMISLQEESSNAKLTDDQKTNISLSVAKSPCYIFVFTTIGDTPEITEENYGAVCCAIQNMQLTATTLGLGVGWSTGKISKIKNLKKLLDVDQTLKIVGVLSIGYPNSNIEKSREEFSNLTKWL
ncbi:MAG: nitroreductase [Dehalococcoidia bacterium]|nr:MAG: hypothetical protein EVA32_03735 [Chloroflexota bacterium]